MAVVGIVHRGTGEQAVSWGPDARFHPAFTAVDLKIGIAIKGLTDDAYELTAQERTHVNPEKVWR